jgi:hypothetical protein
LGDAEHEHHRGQDRGKRHAGDGQADATEKRLDDRRHADAQCHGTGRLTGQYDGALAAFAAETIAETPHAGGRLFARGVEDGRECDREQELDENQAEAADLADEPAGEVAGVGSHLGGQLVAAGCAKLPPRLIQPRPDERDFTDPGG